MNKQKDNPKIEEAIKYLAISIWEWSENKKPTVYHSIRVAFLLMDLWYDEDIVIWALLHDLIEDSSITYENIIDRFWDKIAKLVKDNSYDNSIEDEISQYKDLFKRCKEWWKDSLIVKAWDIYDNSYYYHLSFEKWKFGFHIDKMGYFLEISKDIIWDEMIYWLALEQYNDLVKLRDKYE